MNEDRVEGSGEGFGRQKAQAEVWGEREQFHSFELGPEVGQNREMLAPTLQGIKGTQFNAWTSHTQEQ